MSSTKPQAAAAKPAVVCAYVDCDVEFTPKRATAKYHSATCRQRARRQRTAAEANAAEEAKTAGDAEHLLVRAVRLELEKATAIDTVEGQIALQLARRLADPEESGPSALAREVRAALARAVESSAKPEPGAAAAPAAVEDDEVAQARRRQEEKAAAAAAAAAGSA